MTPAIRLLKKQKIEFELIKYQHDPNIQNFGNEAVTKLSLNADTVFKTLIVNLGGDNFITAIIGVDKMLCLKQVAKACMVKKAFMADKQQAQKITGYLLGGISPLGQKKKLTTLIDIAANNLEFIYVSGGRRGLEIKLKPTDLQTLLNATFCQLNQTQDSNI